MSISQHCITPDFPRQALHAERLGIEHPETGEWMEWQVDMPDDMQQLLGDIRAI